MNEKILMFILGESLCRYVDCSVGSWLQAI